MRRILVSRRLSPRHPPLSISRRACISSISASSNSHLYFKPRGSSLNSSLAVNSGLNNNRENILPIGPANTPSPEKNPSQDSKDLLQVLQVQLLIFGPSDHLTPLRQYQKLISSGVLRGDDHQTRIIQKLQDLHDELLNYDPPMVPYPTSENSIVSLLDPFYPSKLNII